MLATSAFGVGPVSQPQFSNLSQGGMREEEIFFYSTKFFGGFNN